MADPKVFFESLEAIARLEKDMLTFYDKAGGEEYDITKQSTLYLEAIRELADGKKKMTPVEKTSFWMKYNPQQLVEKGLVEVRDKKDHTEVKLTKLGKAYEKAIRGYDMG